MRAHFQRKIKRGQHRVIFRTIAWIGFGVLPLCARTLPLLRFEAPITPVALTQDSDGLLWVAAATGVYRLEGQRFERIRAPGIDLARARYVCAAGDHSVWIGTENGLFRWRDGRLSRELSGSIEALVVTPHGHVVARVLPKDTFAILMETGGASPQWFTLQNHLSSQIRVARDATLFYALGAQIRYIADSLLPRFITIPEPWESLTPIDQAGVGGVGDWSDVVRTPDRTLWARNGPDVVRIQDGRVTGISSFPTGTFDGVIPGFFLDHRGRLWIPGIRLGLADKGVLLEYPHSDPPLENVSAIFEDRHGTMWFGLPGKGLVSIPSEESLRLWSVADGIASSVSDIARHPQLGLVAATESGAVALDAGKDLWVPIPGDVGRLAQRSIIAASDRSLLTMPFRGGLLRGTSPFTKWDSIALPSEVDPGSLRRFYHDATGSTLVAATSGILALNSRGIAKGLILPGTGRAFDANQVKFLLPMVPPNLISDGTRPADIASTGDGQLWVGYEGGVAICRQDNCSQAIAPRDGLLDPRIRSIAVKDSDVWVAYREPGGFSRFRKEQDRWVQTAFLRADGFEPPDTEFIRRDRRGWVWRGTRDGVYVSDGIHSSVDDWIKITFGDAPNVNAVVVNSFLEQPDGTIWIGTQTAIARIVPDDRWFQPTPPHLGSIRWGADEIQEFPASLPGGAQDLEIHVSLPELPSFQMRSFRYRLLPSEPNWRSSADGTIHYSHLSSGRYRFQLAAGSDTAPIEHAFSVGSSLSTFIPWLPIPAGAGILAAGAAAWSVRKRRKRREVHLPDLTSRRFEAFAPEVQGVIGTLLDHRFEVESILAHGGFGTVLLGRDRQQGDQPCAVKLFRQQIGEDAWIKRRFEHEVAALQQIHHANVVRIFGHGYTPAGAPYLAMEFIDGKTMREQVESGPIAPQRIAQLLRQAGSALSEIHAHGIFHRDLKPENLMLRTTAPPGEELVILDFSIAIIKDPNQSMHGKSRAAGSVVYMAPESAIGYASPATDVQGLAKTLIEMMTGRRIDELMPDAALDLPVRVRGALADLPFPISDASINLIGQAMEFHPMSRPQNARDFAYQIAADLERLGD